jgi:hypothetical protein
MKSQKKQFEQTKNKLESLISQIYETLELIPQKGNTSNDCQKISLLNALNEFEHCVSGLEIEDFKPNGYSGDFTYSY